MQSWQQQQLNARRRCLQGRAFEGARNEVVLPRRGGLNLPPAQQVGRRRELVLL